jgi:hypothetical protein
MTDNKNNKINSNSPLQSRSQGALQLKVKLKAIINQYLKN